MTDTAKTTQVRLVEVDAEFTGQRIDNFLLTLLKGAPRSLIYRILRKGEVRVNKGRIKPEYRLQAGDVVRIPPVKLPDATGAESMKKHILVSIPVGTVAGVGLAAISTVISYFTLFSG